MNSLYIDESEGQTRRITEAMLREASGDGLPKEVRDSIREAWRDAVRLLSPKEVVIGFARRIKMPSAPVRVRRDMRRVLDVIRVVAWLHQHQRPHDDRGRVLAAEEDFYTAVKLVSESLARAWKALTPGEEMVLEKIKALPKEKREEGFKRRDVSDGGTCNRRVNEILKSLTETGYLDCVGSQGPQGFTYTLAGKVEENRLPIFLSPQPDGGQGLSNEGVISGGGHQPDRRPTEPDDNGLNDSRPLNPLEAKGLEPIGLSDGENIEEISDACEPEESDDAFDECMAFFETKSRGED